MKVPVRDQVYTGVRLALGAVAGTCTLILLAYGLNKLRFPEVDNSLFTFLKTYPPRLVGATCVAISLILLASTAAYWAKMLSGLFAYATFGALIAVVGGGFRSRIPSLQLTRSGAAAMAALFAACSLLTMRFGKRKLRWFDRLAALSAPVLLMWAGTSDDAVAVFRSIGCMLGVFTIVAVYEYLDLHRKRKTKTT